MPKISAPTVAEHRERVTAAIIRSTREVLLEKGYAGMTLGEVASLAGVARTSIYDYFVSKDDVLLAVLEEDIPKWVEIVNAAVAGKADPRDQVAAYLEALLGIAADGGMELATISRNSGLSKFALKSLSEMVQEMAAPLATAMRSLGQKDEGLAVMLVLGIVDAAVWFIGQGQPRSKVIPMTVSLILDGVDVKSRSESR